MQNSRLKTNLRNKSFSAYSRFIVNIAAAAAAQVTAKSMALKLFVSVWRMKKNFLLYFFRVNRAKKRKTSRDATAESNVTTDECVNK